MTIAMAPRNDDYDINSPGVARILKDLQEPAEDFQKSYKGITKHFERALELSGSKLINKAAEQTIQYYTKGLKDLMNRIVASPAAAADATLAYQRGDGEMARNAKINDAEYRAQKATIPQRLLKDSQQERD